MITQLETVTVKNFLSYGEQEQTLRLDNLGLTLLSGQNSDSTGMSKNGTGKSSILEAIYYAFYGKTAIKNMKSKDIVNKTNKRNSLVALKFKVNDDVYEIYRYLFDKKHKSKVLLFENGKDITAKSNLNTNKQIAKVIGLSKEAFLQAYMFGLGGVNTLADDSLGDEDKKRILEEVAQLNIYKQAQDIAKKKVKDLKDKLRDLQLTASKKQGAVDTQKQRLLDKQTEAKNIKNDQKLEKEHLTQKKAEAKANATNIKQQQQGYATQQQQRLVSQQKEIKLTEQELLNATKVASLEKKLQELDQQKQSQQQVITQEKQLQIKIAEIDDENKQAQLKLTQFKTELNNTDDQLIKLKAQINDLKKGQLSPAQITKLEKKQQNLLNKQQSQEQVLAKHDQLVQQNSNLKLEISQKQEKISNLTTQLETHEKLVQDNQAEIASLKQAKPAHCKTCGQLLTKTSREVTIKNDEKLIKDLQLTIQDLQERITQGATKLKQLAKDLQQSQKEIPDVSKVTQLISEYQKDYQVISNQLNENQQNIVTLNAQNNDEKTLKEQRKSKNQAILDINTQLTNLKQQRNKLDQQLPNIEEVNAKINQLVVKEQQIKSQIEANAKVQRHLNDLEDSVKEINLNIKRSKAEANQKINDEKKVIQANYERNMTKHQSDLQANQKVQLEFKQALLSLKADLNGVKTLINDNEETLKLFNILNEDIYSKGGVRARAFDAVYSYLNNRANEYLNKLTDGSLRVRVTYQAEDKKPGDKPSKYDDNIKIMVRDKNGERDHRSFSSGERRRIDVSIALALQDYILKTHRSAINLIVYDEVFDGLDDEGVERVVGILKDRCQEFPNIIVVSHTHDEYLRQLFNNNNLVVKKEGSFSKLIRN